MNIEQAVKQAIEEFGESAFERFRLFLSNCEEDAVNGVGYWFVFEDNDHMIMCPEFDDIQLKPLPELFNHDVKFYGADAYLMWEFHSVEWCDYESNDEVLNTTRRLRRKNSAKLPFDIERAKAGDVVEMLMAHTGQWERVPMCDLVYTHGQEHRMRMKYLKKAAI